MSDFVELFEVGPRDGLQNEAGVIPTADKIALVDRLSAAGFRRIECASFVNPKWVPQMASSGAVLDGITRRDGVAYVALTPNMRGFDDAVLAKADEVAVFGSASEGFSKANINASIDESFERFAPVITAAKALGVPVRGYVSCVVDCPYDGKVAPANVARVAARLWAMGCAEISLGDTLGHASVPEVEQMLDAVCAEVPVAHVAGHYHDTGGGAVAAIEASLAKGVRIFDTAVGGLGGCPYAPGAAGNVATETVLARLTELGLTTGLDSAVIAQASIMAQAMRA